MRGSERVEILVSRAAYPRGDVIAFRISNRFGRAIYFRYGCGHPLVYRLDAEGEIQLTLETDDSLPDVATLAPGHDRDCHWDQRAWQAPGEPGRERYALFESFEAVPPGRYRFGLAFSDTPAEVDRADRLAVVSSTAFAITSP
jgi:hypothetical protein